MRKWGYVSVCACACERVCVSLPYRCETCPPRGTSESGSIGTCCGSSSGSCSGVRTCRTPASGEWSSGKTPVSEEQVVIVLNVVRIDSVESQQNIEHLPRILLFPVENGPCGSKIKVVETLLETLLLTKTYKVV